MPVTLDILFLGELRALGEPGSCPCLWSTPSQGWSGSRETVAMAGSLPLSLSWLDPQACLCPAGFLICTRSLHEQHLDSEPLAKHSRFFGYRDFVKGPGAFPGLFMAHADSYSCWNFTYSRKYFPSILGEACVSVPAWPTHWESSGRPASHCGTWSVLPPPAVLPQCLGC